jgi:hypothetical protein
MNKTKAAMVAQIRELIESRNDAVEKAVLCIYERQTESEKAILATTDHNGRGFGAFDAEILSSFAQQIVTNKWNRPKGSRLTERQMVIARKKMKHYAGQLADIALAKQQQEVAA